MEFGAIPSASWPAVEAICSALQHLRRTLARNASRIKGQGSKNTQLSGQSGERWCPDAPAAANRCRSAAPCNRHWPNWGHRGCQMAGRQWPNHQDKAQACAEGRSSVASYIHSLCVLGALAPTPAPPSSVSHKVPSPVRRQLNKQRPCAPFTEMTGAAIPEQARERRSMEARWKER